MSHDLTEIDNFDPDVTVPDGTDTRTALSVEIPFQQLANRSRNHQNRLNDAEIAIVKLIVRATAYGAGAAVAIDAAVPLSLDVNVGGFSIEGGDTLVVPDAGSYEVSIQGALVHNQSDTVATPYALWLTEGSLGGGHLYAVGLQPVASTGKHVVFAARGIVDIADPSIDAGKLQLTVKLLAGSNSDTFNYARHGTAYPNLVIRQIA